MFSTDKNIESIAQLIERLKQYASLRVEHAKFNIIEKMVRIITVLITTLIFAFLLVLMLIYLSFAASYAIASIVDSYVIGFLTVAAFYFVLLLILVSKRKSWIERPLVRFIASILLE